MARRQIYPGTRPEQALSAARWSARWKMGKPGTRLCLGLNGAPLKPPSCGRPASWRSAGPTSCADGASWAVACSGDDRLAPASAKVGDKRPPEPACEDQSRPNGSRRLALAHTCREWVRQISAGTTPVRSHRGKPNVSRSHCTTAASNYAGGSEGWSARMRSCAGVVQWQNISFPS